MVHDYSTARKSCKEIKTTCNWSNLLIELNSMAAKKGKKKQNYSVVFFFGMIAFLIFLFGIHFGKNLSMTLSSNVMPTPIPADAVITGEPVFKETYTGVLPCADCSGLQTTLTFSRKEAYQSFGTYELQENYEGKSVQPLITTGKWTMLHGTPSNSNAVVYELRPTDSEEVDYYLKVNNTQIMMLDSNQNVIDSPFNFTLTKQNTTQLANPASVHCIDQGGVSEIRKDESGNEYGICKMNDGRECDEWAFFRENTCKSK